MIVSLLVISDKERLMFTPILDADVRIEKNFDIVRVSNYEDAVAELAKRHFSIIVTIEDDNNILYDKYPQLFTELPNYLKNRWFNFSNIGKLSNHQIAYELISFYSRIVDSRFSDFVSIITPVYHTKRHVIERTYDSLVNQTNKNWEWIIVDDSKDKSLSVSVRALAKKDFRIKYYNFEHSGVIGNVKRQGFSLACGDYLLELDHDDVLMPNALQNLIDAFAKYPDAGFVYSDCAEVNINEYNEIVGFRNYATNKEGKPSKGSWGYSNTGYAVDFNYNGYNVLANVSPFINAQSIRHIISSPNHLRCWKRDVYEKVKKHSEYAIIADDYELMARTFLYTRFVHLRSVEYVQFYEVGTYSNNTQYDRNPEIQRSTNYFSIVLDKRIHDRIIELGYDDYCWNEEANHSEYWKDYGICSEDNKLNYTYVPQGD